MRKIFIFGIFLICYTNMAKGQGFLTDLDWVSFRHSGTCFYIDAINPEQTAQLDNLYDEIKSDLIYDLRMAQIEVVDSRSEGRGGNFVFFITIERRGTKLYNYYGTLDFTQRVRDISRNDLTTSAIIWQKKLNGLTNSKYKAEKQILNKMQKSIKEFLKEYFEDN